MRASVRRGIRDGALLAAAGAGVLGWMYYAGLWRFNYPSPERFPIRGVDISHHQGHVEWFKASLHGVDFAYLKATEGTDFKDRQFAYNWDQCRKNNLPHGAYHFFSLCRPAAQQARNFLETVPPDDGALPPALDLEFSGNCRREPSRAQLQREVRRFVDVLSKRFPGPPVFYVTPDFYKRYFDGHEQEYPPHRLWIRNVLKEPSQKPCRGWTFWQYADHGRIEGIRGPVDLNVYCADAEPFSALLREPRAAGQAPPNPAGNPPDRARL